MNAMSKPASRVMRTAHLVYLYKLANRVSCIAYDPQLEWRNSLKFAWYIEKFKSWLTNGVVTFSYMKKDGEIREAKGTLCDILIPYDDRPKSTICNKPLSIINYFDINKKGWRSFSITHFIGFVTIYELKEKR